MAKKLKLKELPDAQPITLLEAARDDAPNQATQANAQLLEGGFSSQIFLYACKCAIF